METKAEVWIPLTQGKVTVIDFEDFEKVRGFNFRLLKGAGQVEYAYISLQKDGKKVQNYLHRAVWGEENIPPGLEIAHTDGDGLNCRRSSNLKCVTHAQNMQGKQGKKKDAQSQFRGVCRDARPGRQKRWYAKIKQNGKKFSLGYYLTEVEAARAYDVAAVKYFGEYAALNFPAL